MSREGSEKCICDLCECGNHRCPHENSGWLVGSRNGSDPLSQSEYNERYIHNKVYERPQLARPAKTSLGRNGGQFDVNTTHLSDYKQWNNSQRAQAFRPNDIYQGPTSPFEGATTHRMDFNEKKGNVIKATKPPTANRREPGPFDHTTTNRQDYKVFPGQRQRTSYRPVSSRYLADAPFDATTEHRSNFDGKTVPIQRVTRPITQYRPNEEPLDGQTTYRLGFNFHKKAEPAQSMKPANERLAPTDPFNALTTHRTDFIERKNDRDKLCPAEVVLTKKTSNYHHIGQRDGHRFYRRANNLSGGSNRELTRIIG